MDRKTRVPWADLQAEEAQVKEDAERDRTNAKQRGQTRSRGPSKGDGKNGDEMYVKNGQGMTYYFKADDRWWKIEGVAAHG